MTLYETLDLDKAADAAAIKRAYKRKAKMTHPDKAGGSNEAFAKVSRAYLVLSDPARRARYDATGDIPEITPESAPLNILVQYFVIVVQMFCNGQGPDPRNVNLVNQAREQFRKDILDAENQQVKLRRSIKLWQDVAERFSTKKKADTVKLSLLGQVSPLEAQLRLMDEQIQIRKDALKLLDGYTFRFRRRGTGCDADMAFR
jgi:curved DNA-binding protein CbpA